MKYNFKGYEEDALIIANASTFRHGAKISYIQMVHLIIGFAHGASISAVAEKAKTHRDTVRDTFEIFRMRLLEPRFEKWVQSAYASLNRTSEEDAALMNEVKDALFSCYQNTECMKRYRAGRRKTRVCRGCTIKRYVDDNDGDSQDTEPLIQMVDDLREFYRLLGWKESSAVDADPHSIFEKRFRHYEVFSTAVTNTEFSEDGKVISTEDDFLSIPHFAQTLTDELKENPLR